MPRIRNQSTRRRRYPLRASRDTPRPHGQCLILTFFLSAASRPRSQPLSRGRGASGARDRRADHRGPSPGGERGFFRDQSPGSGEDTGILPSPPGRGAGGEGAAMIRSPSPQTPLPGGEGLLSETVAGLRRRDRHSPLSRGERGFFPDQGHPAFANRVRDALLPRVSRDRKRGLWQTARTPFPTAGGVSARISSSTRHNGPGVKPRHHPKGISRACSHLAGTAPGRPAIPASARRGRTVVGCRRGLDPRGTGSRGIQEHVPTRRELLPADHAGLYPLRRPLCYRGSRALRIGPEATGPEAS